MSIAWGLTPVGELFVWAAESAYSLGSMALGVKRGPIALISGLRRRRGEFAEPEEALAAPSALAALTAPILMLQDTADVFYPNNAQGARAFEAAMLAAGKSVQSRYFDGAPHQLLFMASWHNEATKLAASFLADRLAK